MISYRLKFTIISILCTFLLAAELSANHKDGHTSEGLGQIDTTQYACNGLGATECMLMKLDRIERKLGCPLEDYLDATCPYSPADTTATFCISQGREGGIGADWGVIPYMEGELGAGWPNVGWGKLTAKVENPLFIPKTPIPIPTNLSIGGSASLGRNFDICIEVPLAAAEHAAGINSIPDAEVIDRIVRQINEPPTDGRASRSKFQRRLGRLANYAIFRVPGTNRFGAAVAQENTGELARIMSDDGESEFDSVEQSLDQLMSGDWEIPENGGPLGKSPVVDELRTVLEVPDPVQQLIDDPDIILGRIFEIGGLAGSASVNTASGRLTGGSAVCNAFGFNEKLQEDFTSIKSFCGMFGSLPTFLQTTGIFSLVAGLPNLDEIKAAACEIAGWNCPEKS